MRHGLKWFIHLRAQRPQVGDKRPAYAPAGAWLSLPFLKYFGKRQNRYSKFTQLLVCIC